MAIKYIQVFYGTDNLPYKDQARTVHFPITGQAFLGASNTTQIRFYIDQIGSINDTWVANAKLPNGKMGNKILGKGVDSDLQENYVYLDLSTFYTQAKGDLYISLNSFYGSVNITYDSLTDQYEINGIPTIQATGSIKLQIAYAVPLSSQDVEDTLTLQDLLAAISLQLPKLDSHYLKVIDSISNINNSLYENYLQAGDIIYSISEKAFYYVSGSYPSFTTNAITFELNDLIIENELRVVNGASYLTFGDNGLESLQDYLDAKQNQIAVVNLTTQSGTIASALLSSLALYPSYLTYGDHLFAHVEDDSTYYYFKKLFATNIIDNNTNLTYGEVWVRVNKTTGVFDTQLKQTWFYSKAESDDLLALKADKSNTYTKAEVDSIISSVYKPQGSASTSTLNGLTKSSTMNGYVYNVSNAGTLTNSDSTTLSVNVGDNVVFIWNNGSWYWDDLAGIIDLSGYVLKTTTIAGVDLQDNITAQELTDALVFMNNTTDIDYVMED